MLQGIFAQMRAEGMMKRQQLNSEFRTRNLFICSSKLWDSTAALIQSFFSSELWQVESKEWLEGCRKLGRNGNFLSLKITFAWAEHNFEKKAISEIIPEDKFLRK